MTAASLARRRILLRGIVLVQVVLLGLVAWSVHSLVSIDGQVPPGMVVLVAAMIACTAVALRATFDVRGHRIAFMAAEALCVLLPLVAEKTWNVLSAREPGVISSGTVETMMGIELLAAGCVAAIAALVAPYLLAPPPEARADSPNDRSLAAWVAIALAATIAVGVLYKTQYDETHTPEFLLGQLFSSPSPVQQRLLAIRLLETHAIDDAAIRDKMYALVETGPVHEKAWAAFLLIAAKADDGRAMTALRSMIGGFATLRAVESLALLGELAAPATADLGDVMRKKTTDALIADIQSRAADALAQIGPPAIDTVPALVAKLDEKDHWELRLSAAAAIDRIDPAYAARCVVGYPTVLDALPTETSDVQLNPDCQP